MDQDFIAKADYYKTARLVATGEFVSVKHIGDGHFKVWKQGSSSTAFMPAQERGITYLDRFTL